MQIEGNMKTWLLLSNMGNSAVSSAAVDPPKANTGCLPFSLFRRQAEQLRRIIH